MAINLAADLGFGSQWLLQLFTISSIVGAAFFVYVVITTKYKVKDSDKDSLKAKIFKYHSERYWAILTVVILGYFLASGWSWAPPDAFENGLSEGSTIHVVKVTAGQWHWDLEDGGYYKIQNGREVPINSGSGTSQSLHVKAGETVKFVAVSEDVNHGFSVLKSDDSMDTPLMQMQVMPGYENVFYYTFKNPGEYTIRCLEYCGWLHPYMVTHLSVY